MSNKDHSVLMPPPQQEGGLIKMPKKNPEANSHEFKTPLLTIIYILKSYINNKNLRESFVNNSGSLMNISANLQQKNYRNNNGLSADDYIRNTIDLSDYMLSLINDIIDYSIINSEFDFKCEFEKFEFSEMLEFSFRILKILLACKGLNDSIYPILLETRCHMVFY